MALTRMYQRVGESCCLQLVYRRIDRGNGEDQKLLATETMDLTWLTLYRWQELPQSGRLRVGAC